MNMFRDGELGSFRHVPLPSGLLFYNSRPDLRSFLYSNLEKYAMDFISSNMVSLF